MGSHWKYWHIITFDVHLLRLVSPQGSWDRRVLSIYCCRTCLMSWIPRHRRDHSGSCGQTMGKLLACEVFWLFYSWEFWMFANQKFVIFGKNFESLNVLSVRKTAWFGGGKLPGPCFANDYYSWNVEDGFRVSRSSRRTSDLFCSREKMTENDGSEIPKRPPLGCKKRPVK